MVQPCCRFWTLHNAFGRYRLNTVLSCLSESGFASGNKSTHCIKTGWFYLMSLLLVWLGLGLKEKLLVLNFSQLCLPIARSTSALPRPPSHLTRFLYYRFSAGRKSSCSKHSIRNRSDPVALHNMQIIPKWTNSALSYCPSSSNRILWCFRNFGFSSSYWQ